eukprot:661754-Prymnesium_polylepis.1
MAAAGKTLKVRLLAPTTDVAETAEATNSLPAEALTWLATCTRSSPYGPVTKSTPAVIAYSVARLTPSADEPSPTNVKRNP